MKNAWTILFSKLTSGTVTGGDRTKVQGSNFIILRGPGEMSPPMPRRRSPGSEQQGGKVSHSGEEQNEGGPMGSFLAAVVEFMTKDTNRFHWYL